MIVFPPNASRYDATSEIAEAQRKDRELIARLEKRVAELELFKERLTSALRSPEKVKKGPPSPFVIKTHWSDYDTDCPAAKSTRRTELAVEVL